MIWLTWRQHRAEATVGAVIFSLLAGAMVVVGNIARDRARALGLPACSSTDSGCSNALEKLHQAFHAIPPFTAALVAIPLLAGMFWAAPLVSREYEAGTHRLAWTQSVSPLRWLVIKIVLIFGTLAAASLALGLLATWTLRPLTPAFGGRYNSTWYDIQGGVPVACMLFALGVGVAASALIRRTIPAMAVTLFVYAAARIPVHWVRWHFAPVTSRLLSVPVSALLANPGGSPRDLATSTLAPGDWLQGFTITDSAGHPISTNIGNFGLIEHYCPNVVPTRDGTIHIDQVCHSVLESANVHETIRYQPATHFWLIQGVESAIFLSLAAVVTLAAILAITSHRSA
jgi:hypothetical protein